MKSEMKMPRDREREVKFQIKSREFSRNETLAGYCPPLPYPLPPSHPITVFQLAHVVLQMHQNKSGTAFPCFCVDIAHIKLPGIG